MPNLEIKFPDTKLRLNLREGLLEAQDGLAISSQIRCILRIVMFRGTRAIFKGSGS